jgi:hypothetical protein
MLEPMLMGSALNNCYTPYGYGYRSYYSMCGMGYSPFLYDYYGYAYKLLPGRSWVGIGGIPPATGIPVAQAEGRAINGHGYTQIRNREPEPTARVHSGGNGSAGGYSTAAAARPRAAIRRDRRAPDPPAARAAEIRARASPCPRVAASKLPRRVTAPGAD